MPARLLYWPSGASIAKELSLPAEIVENDQLALVDLKDRIQLEVRGSSSIGEELRFYNLSLDQSDAFEVPEWLNQLSKSTEKDLGALIKQGEISSLSLSLMPGVNPEAPAVQLLDELQQGIEREQDLVGWVEDPSGRLWLVRAESQHVEANENERIAALELLPVVHGDSGKFVIQKDATTRVVLNKEVSLAGVEGVAITTDGLLLAGIPLSTDADDHSSQVNIQWLSLDADELAATAGKTIELDVTQTLNVGLGDGIGSSAITVEGLLPFQAPLPDQGFILFGRQAADYNIGSAEGGEQLWTLELPGVIGLERAREAEQLETLADQLSRGVVPLSGFSASDISLSNSGVLVAVGSGSSDTFSSQFYSSATAEGFVSRGSADASPYGSVHAALLEMPVNLQARGLKVIIADPTSQNALT